MVSTDILLTGSGLVCCVVSKPRIKQVHSSVFQYCVIDQQLVNIWLKNPIVPFISVTSTLYRMIYIQMW